VNAEADVDVRVRRWDMVGMVVSAACVVHCVAMPLVLGLLPAFGLGFLARDGFHQALSVVVLVTALGAFVPGFRTHRQGRIPLIGFLGAALLGFAAFAPLSLVAESILTATGGTVLVFAHVMNRRALSHEHAHQH
jgi:MerC mercury resistance protein